MATACMVDGVLAAVRCSGEPASTPRSIAFGDLSENWEKLFSVTVPVRLEEEEEEFEDEEADDEFDDDDEDIDDEEFEDEDDVDEFEDDDIDDFDDDDIDEDLDEEVEEEGEY
jgi:hypothetical protein